MGERETSKAGLIIGLILGALLLFSASAAARPAALAPDTLAAAITAIGSAETTLLIPNVQAVTADLTVPANITLRFNQGGSLNISTGVTVTINGGAEAGIYRIFQWSGTGKAVFGSGKEVYPEWWGAKGDFVQDDSDALIAAHAALPNGGTIRFSPNRVYKVTKEIPISYNHIALLGNPNSKIKMTAAATILQVTGDYFSARNLIIEGNGSTEDDGSVGYTHIRLYQAHHALIENCTLLYPYVYGVMLKESYNTKVVKNYIEGNFTTWTQGHIYHAGICCQCAVGSYIAGNKIVKCVQGMFITLSSSPLDVDGENNTYSRHLIIDGNLFYGNMNRHIASWYGYRCIVTNNVGRYIKEQGQGIMWMTLGETVFTGNQMTDCNDPVGYYGGSGIAIDKSDNNLIANNRCTDNDDDGILIKNSVGCKVVNNECRNNGRHGVHVLKDNGESGSTLWTQVSGNRCFNNGQIDAGDGIRVASSGAGAGPAYTVVADNICADDQGTPTQDYGIQEAGLSNYSSIHGNLTKGNGTDGIVHVGANSVEADNLEA